MQEISVHINPILTRVLRPDMTLEGLALNGSVEVKEMRTASEDFDILLGRERIHISRSVHFTERLERCQSEGRAESLRELLGSYSDV